MADTEPTPLTVLPADVLFKMSGPGETHIEFLRNGETRFSDNYPPDPISREFIRELMMRTAALMNIHVAASNFLDWPRIDALVGAMDNYKELTKTVDRQAVNA